MKLLHISNKMKKMGLTDAQINTIVDAYFGLERDPRLQAKLARVFGIKKL
jgi:hypothetical protein